MARNLLQPFEKNGAGWLAFYCCTSSSCIKLLVLKGHLYNAGERSVPARTTVSVVILTLQETSAKAPAVRPRKLATNPLPWSTCRYGAVHRNMCTGRWDIWIPSPVTRVRIEVFNARESHANSTAYGGIFRYHATPTSAHGAQEGRFSGALYPEYPTLQLPSYHCGGSQGHAWR